MFVKEDCWFWNEGYRTIPQNMFISDGFFSLLNGCGLVKEKNRVSKDI